MKIAPEQAWNTYKNADLIHDEKAVNQAFEKMASAINADLQSLNPLLVCVLNGGIIPFSELLQRLQFPLQTDYIHVTRYGGSLTGGHTSWLVEPHTDPAGRHILIVDDILDEGETLASIIDYYFDKKAASVRSAVLVVKDRPRKINYMADYVGLHVPDRYVFGFGMDYKGYLRNLTGIYAEKEHEGS
ncbi:MAG: hypoxanthine-guanine phosphoribosyltransferase [Acidiferrobacterales bacterium]